MTLECFKKQFADAKCRLPLDDAADRIHRMKDEIFPILPKTGSVNHEGYIHRMALRTACDELEKVIRGASPWEDYREIFAELEWPYMRRVVGHIVEKRYAEEYGEKEGEADALFVELWFCYHEIFERMPGVIPDTPPWKRYYVVTANVKQTMKKYRRKL